MPYYGMPVGTDLEEVGFSFNKQVITGLLRERLGFDGVVCTDWGVLSHTPWGVEHLTFEERMLKALDAGIDQFGGETTPEVLVGLVRSGAVPESRLDVSARRLLREKFRLGLFDDPFVDPERAEVVVGAAGARERGIAAQAAAHTLLRNAASGPARLPLQPGSALFLEGIAADAVGDRARVVDDPSEADVAVVRLQAPWEQRGEPGTIESFFHAGSLDFPQATLSRLRDLAAVVPTVVVVYLDRPAVLTDVAEVASSLLVDFGASEQAFVRVLFGDDPPRGRLPFDLPSSMEAVERSRSDVPFDTADPLFRFGSGLTIPLATQETGPS